MERKHFVYTMAACAAVLFVACSGKQDTAGQAEEETVQLVRVEKVTEQAVPQDA